MTILSFIVKLIPYKSIYPFSKVLGNIFYYILRNRTKIAFYNLDKIFPEMPYTKKKYLVKKSYTDLISNLLELIKIENFSKKDLEKIFYVHNVDKLENVLKQNKGCVLVTGHFGNWELSVVLPMFINHEILTVGKKQKPEFFNNFLFKLRTNFGMKVIDNKKAILPIFKTLKKKGIVGLIIDQRSRKENSCLIDFFGEKIYCNTTPAFLSLKTGAPVIGCYAKRDKNNIHHFYFTDEIQLERTGNFEEAINKNTQIIHNKINEIILDSPENWFWLHSKFKSKRRVLLELNG